MSQSHSSALNSATPAGRVPAATPERIQQEALELFLRDGLAATTVDRIAEVPRRVHHGVSLLRV